MNEELQGHRAIGAIERNVGELRGGVGDAIDGAIAPTISGRIFRKPRLARTIAIAIVACGIRGNVQEVPVVGLVVALPIAIGPRRDIGECLWSEKPLHIASSNWGQSSRSQQRDETMALRAPCVDAGGVDAGE